MAVDQAVKTTIYAVMILLYKVAAHRITAQEVGCQYMGKPATEGQATGKFRLSTEKPASSSIIMVVQEKTTAADNS